MISHIIPNIFREIKRESKMNLENRMTIDDELFVENDSEEYLEMLLEEEDDKHEDEIFERLSEE